MELSSSSVGVIKINLCWNQPKTEFNKGPQELSFVQNSVGAIHTHIQTDRQTHTHTQILTHSLTLSLSLSLSLSVYLSLLSFALVLSLTLSFSLDHGISDMSVFDTPKSSNRGQTRRYVLSFSLNIWPHISD